MRSPLGNRQTYSWAAVTLVAGFSTTYGVATAQCLRYAVDVVPGPPCSTFGAGSVARFLNDKGEICGNWRCGGIGSGAVWLGQGRWQNLPLAPGVSYVEPTGINSSRHLAAWLPGLPNPDLYRAAFVDFTAGTITLIPGLPGANTTIAHAINESDVVCGYSYNTNTGVPYSAYRWQKGVTTQLNLPRFPYSVANDIADDGSICGWMGDGQFGAAGHGFVWSSGRTIDLGTGIKGAIGMNARAISRDGKVVCGSCVLNDPNPNAPFRGRAFLWSDYETIDLGVLPGFFHSRAYGVNSAKEVVGVCNALSGSIVDRAFIWRNGNMMDLNQLIPTNLSIHIDQVYAINEAGQITGGARTIIAPPVYGNDVAIRLTPIPPKTGDMNCDWTVNIDDLVGVITRWGDTGGPADLNADGVVNLPDLVIVLTNWNT